MTRSQRMRHLVSGLSVGTDRSWREPVQAPLLGKPQIGRDLVDCRVKTDKEGKEEKTKKKTALRT